MKTEAEENLLANREQISWQSSLRQHGGNVPHNINQQLISLKI